MVYTGDRFVPYESVRRYADIVQFPTGRLAQKFARFLRRAFPRNLKGRKLYIEPVG